MAQEKKGFVVYYDYREHLELLSDEERGRLFMALFEYGETGTVPQMDGMVRMAFSFIKSQMDRDAAKYAKKCARNAENGARGGRPPKPKETEGNPEKPKETEGNPKEPKKSERFSEKPKKADTDTETDTDTDTDTETDTDTDTDTNNIISLSSSFEERDVSEDESPKLSPVEIRFSEFWSAYPRKVGKQHALKAWNKIKPNAKLHDRIMTAIAAQKRSDQWCRENGRFIPNPATWLNGGYWDNEVEEVKPNGINTEPLKPPSGTNWARGFVPADE